MDRELIREILGTFDPVLAIEIAVQILLALLLGGLVGWDRERRQMPAGVRTFMLVCTGSCMFTILSYRGFLGGDPGRVAAQIVAGIGFLGAGVMIQRKGTIYGLTSAAGIWAVAAVGMAVGTGNYFMAIFGAVAIYAVLAVLRQWFKADLVRSTRRTLNTALRQVRGRIDAMGGLVEQAILSAVRAVVEEDPVLSQQVIENDQEINSLRYQVEEGCLDILRTHRPQKIQLRTVLAATHIASNLERIGDYAKEIAQIRLSIEREPLLAYRDDILNMADQVSGLLQQILDAFSKDDVAAAEQIAEQLFAVDRLYETLVKTVTERMTDKKTRHFERGANLLNIAYYLKRSAERVTNIAERIIFVRTGALAELDRED